MQESFGCPLGQSSVTIPGKPGKSVWITSIHAFWKEPGPVTGTLLVREGSTVVWEAAVSGGISQLFPAGLVLATGASVTVELIGATIRVWGGWH